MQEENALTAPLISNKPVKKQIKLNLFLIVFPFLDNTKRRIYKKTRRNETKLA